MNTLQITGRLGWISMLSALALFATDASAASNGRTLRVRDVARTPAQRDDDVFAIGRGGRRSVEQLDDEDAYPVRMLPDRRQGLSSSRRYEAGDSFGIGSSRSPLRTRNRPQEDDRLYRRFPVDETVPSDRPEERLPVSPRRDERPDPGTLIERRYQDPAVLRLLGGLTPEQGVGMYAETVELILSRHLAPPSPAVLVERGMENLLTALHHPLFLQRLRLQPAPGAVERFAEAVSWQLQQSPARDAREAVLALQQVMQLAMQHLGLPGGVVTLEFEYGALDALDRFSAFTPEDSARTTNQQLGEAVVGIGVQIEACQQGAKVMKVLRDGPAAQVGMQPGDVITAVDGRSLAGVGLDSATEWITGPEGTPLTLSLIGTRGASGQIRLVRRSITLHSVSDVRMIDPALGVGYMKLETFASNSTQEMQQALWNLQQQGMQSLVLDLRGDPGGLLTTAIEVARLFLPSGTIVSTRGRTAADNTTEVASGGETWRMPLAVLVDGHSASASEILAAAIQENGRGLIVGRLTYGKGTVQTLFPLQSVSAGLRLTTAKFYSPEGREMAGTGVEPDLPVEAHPDALEGDPHSDVDLQAAHDALAEGMSAVAPASGRQHPGRRSAPGWSSDPTNFRR
ncbi:MAG: S41 family peptidase [Planctomycetales bacterium]